MKRLLLLIILLPLLAYADPPQYEPVSPPWHGSQILELTSSGDGRVFAALDLESRVGVWTLQTTEPRLLFTSKEAKKIALNGDGTLLAVANSSHQVTIFDTNTGKSLARLQGHTDEVVAMAFGSGKFATTSKDKSFRVWATDGWRPLLHRELEQQGAAVALSPNGQELAVATGWEFGTIHTWNLKNGQRSQKLSLDRPNQQASRSSYILPPRLMGYSPDGSKLAAGNFGGVDLWDLRQNLLIAKHPIEARGGPGVTALSVGQDSIRFWDGSQVWELTSDGKEKSRNKTLGRTAKLTFLRQGWVEGRVRGQLMAGGRPESWRSGYPEDAAQSITFLPNGELLAGYDDGSLLRWNPATACTVKEIETDSVGIRGLNVLSDQKTLLYGERDGGLTLRELPSLEATARLKGHRAPVSCLRVSADGTRAASGALDGTLILWDLKDKRQLGVLVGHKQAVRDADFSPDGRFLVSAAEDATVRLWDTRSQTETGQLVREGVKTPYTLARFSPDGQLVITAEAFLRDTPLNVWDFKRRRLLHSIEAGTVKSGVFTQSGQLLVATLSGEVHLLDPQEGQLIAKLGSATGYGWELARSANGALPSPSPCRSGECRQVLVLKS